MSSLKNARSNILRMSDKGRNLASNKNRKIPSADISYLRSTNHCHFTPEDNVTEFWVSCFDTSAAVVSPATSDTMQPVKDHVVMTIDLTSEVIVNNTFNLLGGATDDVNIFNLKYGKKYHFEGESYFSDLDFKPTIDGTLIIIEAK